MGRPQLALGTYGRIRTHVHGDGYRAVTQFRDYDGTTKQLQRHGKTKGAAERALATYLRDRTKSAPQIELTPDTRVKVLAERWWAEVELRQLSPGTMRLYRDRLDRQVIPGLGNLTLRELTTGAVDRHLRAVAAKNGPAIAKAVRSVLSGVCSYACRMDAMPTNPVRDVGPLAMKKRKPPRSLSVAEVRQLRALLTYDLRAVMRDVPELVDVMLATGLRVAEAAAIRWSSIDLDAGTIQVGDGIVVRSRGEGLVIRGEISNKLTARTLELPIWCVEMLKKRQELDTLRAGVKSDDIAFPAPLGGLRDPSNTSADLKDAFTAAGFPWMTSHTLRRTVATLMDEAGLSARAAADQLGHRRISMTTDRYFGRKTSATGASAVLEALG